YSEISGASDVLRKGGHRFQCGECGKLFSSALGLKVHTQSVHEGKKYRCDVCGKEFTEASNLKKHMESIHG
ncbi:unnamed protein product, partial [Trichobilharzia szidati]